jgi:hypothetical protein
MALNLDQLSDLVRSVARERRIDAEVVGATPTEGDGRYAEVVVALPARDERVSIGLERDAPVDDLKRTIAINLERGAHAALPSDSRRVGVGGGRQAGGI